MRALVELHPFLYQGTIMKKALFLVLPLLISTAAFGQQQSGPQGVQAQPGAGAAQNGQGRPNFDERKQHMLDRIDQRISTLQNARNCVAQAQNPQALKACRPHREEGGEPRQ